MAETKFSSDLVEMNGLSVLMGGWPCCCREAGRAAIGWVWEKRAVSMGREDAIPKIEHTHVWRRALWRRRSF